ncbi:hypothetical protein M409DRAFT_61721 [Zasmidium cellare ATCC 36951]|uniref:Uncharacterized protein n=1 Tax=Zasmidium cellare ATCC 36951 TaxID=1080233 RepID=A0A6A6BWM1_ZASCE|nr:uncharacterized protein M409DRAFT_61721 [Zasmidium cellare ATCC 36951]KAF2158360.1 hypothetical protein M409DRAFT_61721 [Zasmidium cellare ATCC 36951]
MFDSAPSSQEAAPQALLDAILPCITGSNESPQPPTATALSSSTLVNMTPQTQEPTRSGTADWFCRSTRLKRAHSEAPGDVAPRAKKPRWSQIIALKVSPRHLARLADSERIAEFLTPSPEEEIPPPQDETIMSNADEEHVPSNGKSSRVPATSTDEGNTDSDNIVVKRPAHLDPPFTKLPSRQKTDRDQDSNSALPSRPSTGGRESASGAAPPLTLTAASPKQASATAQGSGVWNSSPLSPADERRPATPCDTPPVQCQNESSGGHAGSGISNRERTAGSNNTRAMLPGCQQGQDRIVSSVSTTTRSRTKRRRRFAPPTQALLPQRSLQSNICYQTLGPGTIAAPTLLAPQHVALHSHTQSQIWRHQHQQQYQFQPAHWLSLPNAVQSQQAKHQPFRTPPTIPSNLSSVPQVQQQHQERSSLHSHNGARPMLKHHSRQVYAQHTQLQAVRSSMEAPSTPIQNHGSKTLFTRAGEQPPPTHSHWTGSGLDQSHPPRRDLSLIKYMDAVQANCLEQISIEIDWARNFNYSDHLSMGAFLQCKTVDDFFSLIETQMPDELRAVDGNSSRVKEVKIKALTPLKGKVLMPRIKRDEDSGRIALRALIRKLLSQPPDANIELEFLIVWE